MKESGFFKTVFYSIKLLYSRVINDSLLKEASALTYQSFLAIVPLLAVMFGIAKGFGLDQILDRWLHKEFADHQEVLTYLLQFSQSTLKEAQGGVIAGIGVFFLLFTAIRLLSSVESTLNSMWGLRRGNTSLRNISHYLAILLTCPLLLAISSSVTIFITTQLTSLTEAIPILASAHSVFIKILALVPFAISAILFSIILYSLPRTHVSAVAACCSGCITAIAFQFIQAWYILFQLHLTKISAVYGSFVALPLFLVWLWISWLLILIAGELLVFFQEKGWRSYVVHYSDSTLEKLDTDVLVLASIKRSFDSGSPLKISGLYTSVHRPIRALTESLQRLEDRGFILKGWSELTSTAVIPSRASFTLSLSDILFPSVVSAQSDISPHVTAALEAWKAVVQKNSFNLSIDQLEKEVSC